MRSDVHAFVPPNHAQPAPQHGKPGAPGPSVTASVDTVHRSAFSTNSGACDFTRVPVRARAPVAIQAQLAVNAPDDVYEQEANRVAAHVLGLSDPRAHACTCGGSCASCRSPHTHAEPLRLQTASVWQHDAARTVAPPSVAPTIAASGRPLDAAVRQFMEPRFGYDFSHVRVHADATAAQSADDLHARAYAVGRDIVFGAGRFAPETTEGRRLLAHELTHVVQQSGGTGGAPQALVQRDIGFEFQTRNLIVSDKGRRFPRKFGKFLHKVPPTAKNGLELQTDTGSVAEFETNHFRKWSELQKQIQDAVDVVADIKKDPKNFPFNQEKRLRDSGDLKKGEKLVVNVTDSAFTADIQYTEGFGLAQYESALKEHVDPTDVKSVISKSQQILNDATKAAKTSAKVNTDNLRGFLEVILTYITQAQDRLSEADRVSPVKARFTLMSRTQFSSMFSIVLSADEQKLFTQIVKSGAIPKALSLKGTDEFFPDGYWGHFDPLWALFQGGKVVALASEDKKTIHDCSAKKKTAGIDASKCGTRVPDTLITVDGWLASITTQKKDVLSPPPGGGSESMGKFDVRTKGPEKDLVVFETRGEHAKRRTRTQPASQWVDYADDVFRVAANCRPRKGTGTELVYDGTNSFNTKDCP